MSLLDSLSEIAPQIMAGFGKHPETLDRVLGVQDRAAAIAEQQNLRAFGDDLFTSGGPMTPEKVMAAAQKHKVDPQSALVMVKNVMGLQDIGKEQPQTVSRILPNGQVNEFQALLSEVQNRFGQDPNVMPGKITGTRTPDPKILTGDGAFGVFNRDSNTIDPLGGLKPVPGAGGPASVNVNLAMGRDGQMRMPLTKPVVGQMQKDVITGMDAVGRLNEIKKSYDPSMLTYFGKAKNWKNELSSKFGVQLSPEDKTKLQKTTVFMNAVEQNFNQYRKEITGAAASVQELDRLKKSMMNADMSPDAFEAAFGFYESEVKRALRLKRALLRQGLPVGSEAFGDQMDNAFLGGASGNSDQEADARWDELEAQGLGDEQIMQRLVEEGYVGE